MCRGRASDIARLHGWFLLDQFAPAPKFRSAGPVDNSLYLMAVEKAFGRMPDETIVTFGTGDHRAGVSARGNQSAGCAARITDAAVEGGRVLGVLDRDGDRSWLRVAGRLTRSRASTRASFRLRVPLLPFHGSVPVPIRRQLSRRASK